MAGDLIDHGGERQVPLERPALEALRSRGEFFWLDVARPAAHEVRLLGDVFGFHPLTIEDALQFGRRPRMDRYDGYVLLVAYAARGDDIVEVHAFFSPRFLVTIRRADSDAFAELRRRIVTEQYDIDHPMAVFYHLVDGMIDTFFPVLSAIDERIDAIGDRVVEEPTDDQLREVFELKRRLAALRRIVVPQRDYLSTREVALAIPGMSDEGERYFRDLYDRLVRLAEAIDSYRDLLTSTMDVYLSTVSNRLGVVMKKLTVIATIFLPITFVTGFFGQNFGWLVDGIGGLGAFLGLGIALELAATAFLLVFMWRRRWF